MKKIVSTIAIAAAMATPAFAQPTRHSHFANPTQGLYLQSFPYVAPSSPAVRFQGHPYTDPDPSIYYYLMRTYREEGTG